MTYLEVGNTNPIEAYEDPDTAQIRFRSRAGETVTVWRFPHGTGAMECFQIVAGSIDRHFAEGARPPWVATDNDGLRDLLLDHFGLTANDGVKPVGWGDPDHPAVDDHGESQPRRVRKAVKKAARQVEAMVMLHYALAALMVTRFEVRTSAGRDHQARVMGDNNSTGTGAYSSGSLMAVSQDDTLPNETDLSLPGEITTGTLVRKPATYAHTVGTASYTLTALWAIDIDVTLYKIGIYAGDNTLVFESMLDAPVIGKPGDSTTVTETITI